jgi:hypothetical protein
LSSRLLLNRSPTIDVNFLFALARARSIRLFATKCEKLPKRERQLELVAMPRGYKTKRKMPPSVRFTLFHHVASSLRLFAKNTQNKRSWRRAEGADKQHLSQHRVIYVITREAYNVAEENFFPPFGRKQGESLECLESGLNQRRKLITHFAPDFLRPKKRRSKLICFPGPDASLLAFHPKRAFA